MSNLSLDASLRTCKVRTEDAERNLSDRYLNPYNTVCLPWAGTDLVGRPVNSNSFYTKAPGCNSALDRVEVESFLRPSYYSYITLDASGIEGNCGGAPAKKGRHCNRAGFGNNLNGQIIDNCRYSSNGDNCYQNPPSAYGKCPESNLNSSNCGCYGVPVDCNGYSCAYNPK